MKIITEAMVEKHLTMDVCIAAMREVMQQVSAAKTTLPIRTYMPIPDTQGKMALMPGTIEEPSCYGIKLVCKYVREPGSPYGTHVGMVLVFDSEAGLPLAMVEGSSLTAIRTAAASAMATDALANPQAQNLGIMGYGEQARRHIAAMLAVRSPETIRIWGRASAKAEALAETVQQQYGCKAQAVADAETLVRSCDLICTTTSAPNPFVKGEWLQPGTHVNLVGAAVASSAEVDGEAVRRSRYFTDYRPAAMAAAGELIDAITDGIVAEDHIVAEIGEVTSGAKPGRRSPDEITIYKSLGVAAQDLAAAHLLYRLSQEQGFGTEIDLLDYSA